MIFNYHSIQTSTGFAKVGNTEPCSDTKKRGSEITQYYDCLLTLTDAHCKTRNIQVICFHATTAQNSHRASPASPHSHKCQPRKFFHHKLYTLLESTSMILIKCSQNTRFPVLSTLSFSLEFLYSSSASCKAQRKKF
jgi:hypothetical protein